MQLDDHINNLDKWDEAVDGALPSKAAIWDANELIAPIQTTSPTIPKSPALVPTTFCSIKLSFLILKSNMCHQKFVLTQIL